MGTDRQTLLPLRRPWWVLVYTVVFALWYLWARAFVIAPGHSPHHGN